MIHTSDITYSILVDNRDDGIVFPNNRGWLVPHIDLEDREVSDRGISHETSLIGYAATGLRPGDSAGLSIVAAEACLVPDLSAYCIRRVLDGSWDRGET